MLIFDKLWSDNASWRYIHVRTQNTGLLRAYCERVIIVWVYEGSYNMPFGTLLLLTTAVLVLADQGMGARGL